MGADWLFDEFAHAGDEHLDPRYVSGYDRKALVDPTEDLAVLRDLGLDDTCTLIDLGAGTGVFALAVAPRCRRVMAVDVSPAMLRVLQERITQQGLSNVEPVQAGFLTYEHRGDPADFVYSRHALHHLPDQWKALALWRIAACLKPGGVLYLRDLIFSFEPEAMQRCVEGWLSHAAERTEDGWTRAELETHLRDEYSTFSWLLEPMLDRAGFDIRQVTHHASGIYSAYVGVKRQEG
jgi:ubiquinone/menaquinone biosynthesis C-methylase UbiE